MDLRLKNKKALVLGSSAGIGKAIAESLLAEGVEVALCARDLKKLEDTAKKLDCKNYFACDLSKSGAGKSAVEKAIKLLGGIDILVTNTGGPKRGTFAEISSQQWSDDFQNLWMSVVESIAAAIPNMKEQNYGRILMLTSFAAKEPRAGLTTSNGFRAGLSGLCKSIANEYAPFGITANALLPGFTNTDRLKELNLTDEKIKQMVPMERLGDPSELADLAAFIVSPRAGYITGQSIVVDGGVLRSY